MANTAYFYVTGPVAAYIKVPTVGAGPFRGPNQVLTDKGPTLFLGHTLKSPEPSMEPKWQPAFSSQTGAVIPADKIYQGQEVKVVLQLQRYDADAIRLLEASPRYGRVSPPGSETYLDIGAMLQRNGLGMCLWLVNEFYGSVNAAAYPDMEIGKFFVCTNVAGIYKGGQGRENEFVQLLLECNWVQAAGGGGTRVCWTTDPAYFKNLPPVG